MGLVAKQRRRYGDRPCKEKAMAMVMVRDSKATARATNLEGTGTMGASSPNPEAKAKAKAEAVGVGREASPFSVCCENNDGLPAARAANLGGREQM